MFLFLDCYSNKIFYVFIYFFFIQDLDGAPQFVHYMNHFSAIPLSFYSGFLWLVASCKKIDFQDFVI